MKVLLIGIGLQGRAALYDLAQQAEVDSIIAADAQLEPVVSFVAAHHIGSKVQCVRCDITQPEQIDALFLLHPDVVVDLLPVSCHDRITEAVIRHGVHLVHSSYASPYLKSQHQTAKEKHLVILPEFGMDPGIDLVFLGEAVRSFDSIETCISYGAGFPEWEAADNPLHYKITWTFEGVIKSYFRPARIILDGELVTIPESRIFDSKSVHSLLINHIGMLEAFPNGDIEKYASAIRIDLSRIKHMGRYVLRWPGHCSFWSQLISLHLLDNEPVIMDGIPVDRKKFLAAALAPYLTYKDNEKDIVVVRVEVTGFKNGKKQWKRIQLIDKRDVSTGFFAMNRSVGFTAAIGALLIGKNKLTTCGVLSPLTDIPFELLTSELRKRGMEITVECG